jgi:hypothetical protein
MKTTLASDRNCWLILALLVLVASPGLAPFSMAGGTSNGVRLAVGPFFAPTANDSLQSVGVALADLLTAELSHESHFQLVERDKVQAVCRELNLSASGLVARNSVAKLGQLLACDWFVSGSLVPCGARTLVWTKVIDVRKGVILDIAAQELQTSDLSATATNIAAFVQTAKSEPRSRQFIALGLITDMSPQLSFKRDDWPRRISALVEKHYHEAGFGVVEMAAVIPVMEERRLEAAGLTANPEQRVQLPAAFWFVDGGCEWTDSSMANLNVGLRVQKVGGPEQVFNLTALSAGEVEKAVLKTLESALSKTNQLNLAEAAKAEVDLLAKRGMEGATYDSPFRPRRLGAGHQNRLDGFVRKVEERKRHLENWRATRANYERLLLRDPDNLQAKHMLGYGLLYDPDPAARERGKELIREMIAARKGTQYAAAAEQAMKNADHPPGPDDEFYNGDLSADLDALEKAAVEKPSDLRIKYNLGALLLHSNAREDQTRAAKLLQEVIAADQGKLAECARKILPKRGTYTAW